MRWPIRGALALPLLWRQAAGHRHHARRGHAEGLEQEHCDFGREWPVSPSDEAVIGRVLGILGGADATWRWNRTRTEWIYRLVKMTAEDPRESLVHHMLHRHGLAPLLTSRTGGARFDELLADRLAGKAEANEADRILAFVEAQDQLEGTQSLQKLLLNLTLGGLRNLHSWDHEWSIQEAERLGLPNCERNGPQGGCVLQAGASAPLDTFMRHHGFTEAGQARLKRWFQSEVWSPIFHSQQPRMRKSFRENFMMPRHTGEMTLHDVRVQEGSDGRSHISGTILWEAGGKSPFDVPVEPAELQKAAEAGSGQPDPAAILDVLTRWTEREAKRNTDFMAQNHVSLWAAEEADFFVMHAQLHAQH